MSAKAEGVPSLDEHRATDSASPSGEWSDERHHVAPEGAQRLTIRNEAQPIGRCEVIADANGVAVYVWQLEKELPR